MLNTSTYNRGARSKRGAFTLIELLVVMVVIAILAAVIVPKFANRSKQSKEAALKSNVKLVRNAVQMFNTDCGCWPATLADLTATSAPTSGKDTAGNSYTITAADWKGPYLQGTIPNDPVSAAAFTYTAAGGTVVSSASGNGLDGTAYSTW